MINIIPSNYNQYGVSICAVCVSGCCTGEGPSYLSISVVQPPTAPIISAGGPTIFCNGGSVTLTGPTGNITGYQWKKDNVNIGTNINTYIATATGNYTLVVSNGCGLATSSTGIDVVVNSTSSPTVNNNGPVCTGNALS